MVLNCPKCSRTIPDDSVYCPYCGHGIQPSAQTVLVSAGSTLIMVATAAHIIFFILSVKALVQIYNWYPPIVTQYFIGYVQLLTFFAFTGFMSGLPASILALARRRYTLTIALSIVCLASSAASTFLSVVVPGANWGTSLFSFFFPLLFPALMGTVLILPRKAEFKQKIRAR